MTNTRIHPVKRVITFIMALLMTLSAIVYYDFSSNAAAYSVSTGSNVWKGWFDAYIAATGAYWNGLGSYNTNYNPFSVNSSGHLVADIKERSNSVNNVNSLIDKATVVSSTKSICPSGYSMTININTSRNATYNAVDKNGWGSFSVGFLTGDPALDCMTNWAFAVQNGFGNSSNGLVLTFGSFVASTNTYDKMIIWLNGTPQHIITLKDIGMTVYCNGTSDTTFALERISSGVYDIVLSNSNGTRVSLKNTLNYTYSVSDDTALYYSAGSFPSGYNDGLGSCLVTDGSFTIKTVNGNVPANEINTTGHEYHWAAYGNYELYECTKCRKISQKRITVTYNANGGTLAGANTKLHYNDVSSAGASVSFVPGSNIIPTPQQGYDFIGWSTDPHATAPDSSFSSATNTTIHAVYAKSTYKLTFDPTGGKFEDNTTNNKVYNIQYGDLYQTIVGDMPNPTKRGYEFNGWIVNGNESLIYNAPDWAADAAYKLYQNSTFTAKWTSIQGYTLTFDANGGTMPSNYQTTYLFYPNERFSDIIGGFPVPTKARHRFIGWQNSEYVADLWESGWGTQPYTFGKDITLIAQWEEIPGYTLTLDAGKGTFADSGDHTAIYTIPPGEKLADHISYPIPTRTGYTFVGWQWNNRTDHFWTDGWGTQPYTWNTDVTFNAVWQPDHVHNVTKLNTVTFDIGGGALRHYDKVRCTICGDELFGFKCFFYSRNSGVIDFSTGGGSKFLNRDVLLTDVFDGAMVSACNTYVLSETSSATVTVKFDPFIRGANQASRDLFLGWTTGMPSAYNKSLGYVQKNGTLTMICDDNYFAYYQSGCSEYLFDATNAEQYTTVGGNIEVSFAELVQENRNFGIAVVPYGSYYDSYISYVPSMKCIDQDDLRATNTWYYEGFGFNLVNLHNYNYFTHDFILYPGTSNRGTGAYRGAPLGRMNTYYANNKGSKYVEAHYDPNYRYSGTMYYRYTKNNNGQIIWYPEFTFDPRRDPADNNPIYDASLGAHPNYLVRDHEDYHKEFDWAAYFDGKPAGTTVIIKDPRMYTTYIGDEDPYKFIRIVAEPHGEVYQSMGQNADGSYNIDDTDPDIRRHEVYIKALHSNVYQGDSYIVYKKYAGEHELPDYRLARDYTKQYNEYSSRYPLYYVYKSGHTYSDYGVSNYDNRFPVMFDRGSLTDRGFEPISGQYEPLWAYGDGGWNCFDVIPNEADGYREEWGGFSQILQYPDPEATLIVNNPYFTAEQRMIYQYSAYQQWDNKVSFNANVSADKLTNADIYGGYNEAYLYTVSHGYFYMPDANMFTRDRYVIAGWAISKERADSGIVDFDCGEQISPDNLCGYTLKDGSKFIFTSFDENGEAPVLYAVWKHIVNFTLEEGDNDFGANPFAKVTYKNALSGKYVTTDFNETKTVKTFAESTVTINIQPAAVGYVYSYLTLNQNNAPLNDDRIITNSINHTFTIFDDTTMTARFVPVGSNVGFYIDRNNKLLRSASDAWSLYPTSDTRTQIGVADDNVIDNALYYLYKHDPAKTDATGHDNECDITVNGYKNGTAYTDTYTDVLYDNVLTLVTDPSYQGNNFVGWKVNDIFVSYDLVYKHRISYDATITAVYSGNAGPAISIVKVATINNKDVIQAQRTAPEGYEVLESGFVVSKSDKTPTLPELYDIETGEYDTSYYKLVSTDMNRDSYFRIELKNATYYGIAYAYYLDPNGDIVSCVTPVFTK